MIHPVARMSHKKSWREAKKVGIEKSCLEDPASLGFWGTSGSGGRHGFRKNRAGGTPAEHLQEGD